VLGSFRDIPFDYEHIKQFVLQMIANPNWFKHLALDDNDAYCGVMIGSVDSFVFSPRLVANEYALFVREGTPSRAKIASMLVRAFIKWACDVHNVTHVQTGDVASINSVGVDALYRRLGFERFGVIYKYSRPGSVV
jgi:ribosomal protein S18 acetylase RimI-like enzyme